MELWKTPIYSHLFDVMYPEINKLAYLVADLTRYVSFLIAPALNTFSMCILHINQEKSICRRVKVLDSES